MTTKDNFLFSKIKHKSFKTSDDQYSDLNLKQNFKCLHISPVQSNSKSFGDNDLCSKYSMTLTFNDENKKSWKNDESSSSKNNRTLLLHISAYENLNEAVSFVSFNDSMEGFIKKQKQITFVPAFLCQNPFEFQRQQSDRSPDPEVSHFRASQRLLNPHVSATSGVVGGCVSGGGGATSMFNFDLSGFPKIDTSSDECMNLPQDLHLYDAEFLESFEKIFHALMDTSNCVVHLKYQNFVASLPKHLQAPSLSDTMLKPCCANLCCYQFSPDCIMRCRLLLPVNNDSKDSTYNILLKLQFFLMKLCLVNDSIQPKICNVNVCGEFFRRVYCIPERRYIRLLNQLLLHFEHPTPHGNSDRVRESNAVLERIGRLVNSVAKLAEPRPDGKGYQFPCSMTKKDVIDYCFPSYPKKLNPTVELARLSGSFHFQKKDDKTKCCTCVKFKSGLNSKMFKHEYVAEAKMHLRNHYDNVHLDKRDYYTRMQCSRDSDDLLSITHDGFSKEATKFPHLFDERLKALTDSTKIMCSLNLAVVHKKFNGSLNSVAVLPSEGQSSSSVINSVAGASTKTDLYSARNGSNNGDSKDQLHAFWNIGQINGSESNVLLSQLYITISKCDKVPTEISIQLDNCPSNKSYTVLGALGLLLLWIPQISKIYLCYPEVGHTHDDADRYFACLAHPLQKKPVYSPFHFQRFLYQHLHGVVTNTLTSPVYDFDTVLGKNVVKNENLKNNHYFELSKDASGDVVIRIAHFIRSERFLQKSAKSGCIFKLFKNTPDLSALPPIVPPREFNMDQFNRLLKAVHHAIPHEHYEELLSLPQFLLQQPSEPFINILELCRSKVIHHEELFQHIPDPDNINLNAFLNNPKVWKSWYNPNSNVQPNPDAAEEDNIEIEAEKEEDTVTEAEECTNNTEAASNEVLSLTGRLATLRKRKAPRNVNEEKKKKLR